MDHADAHDSDIDFTPPQAVREACARGLELKDEYGGKGLREPTLQKARDFAAGRPNDPAHARKMRAWFKRHDVDARPGWDEPPTPGYVARLLWGGDAGKAWVEHLMAQIEAQEADEKASAAPRRVSRKKRASAAPARSGHAAGGAAKKVGKKKAGKKKVTKKAKGKKKAANKAGRTARPAGKKATAKKRTSKKAIGKPAKKAGKKAAKKTSRRTSAAGAAKKKAAPARAGGRKKAGKKKAGKKTRTRG